MNIKTKLIKRHALNDRDDAYLLIKTSKYILTNNNNELLILNNKLEKIQGVSLPKKNIGIHYTYYDNCNQNLLFELDDEDFMMLMNTNNLKIKIIPTPELERGTALSTGYTWNDDYFYAIAKYNDKKLLEINISTFNVKIYPFEDLHKITPELEKKLEVIEQFHCSNIPGTRFFASLDYNNTKTIKIINFYGELIKTISIANELDKELNDEVNPIVYAEKIPHEIRYQDGWFIIIWEKKIVVVSPEDNRITLYPKETFMFMRARFTKTTETSADFVLLTSDYSCKESSELQLYHVEDN